ncbi:uncharacterized protein LOC110023553 [Phalaenopsis equestris]|uniref:uncharacterized protein LOC110023553 n=1 Tax=Phalaenopsis equestris TaxID=78828 RepID=UPI0009E48301|nr:uncharacterized protein LOC110023553 [Phalaenopsis equestris]
MKSSKSQKTQNEAENSSSSQPKNKTWVARSNHVGSSKAAAQTSPSARISKGKGKSVVFPLPDPSVSGKIDSSSTVCLAAPNVFDNKNKMSNYIASKLSRERSLQSCLEKAIIGNVRADAGNNYDSGIKPVGTRCQLCRLDLAFIPKNFSGIAHELPTAAVLPCGHCFHKLCLEAVFGTVEPPCVTCLDR